MAKPLLFIKSICARIRTPFSYGPLRTPRRDFRASSLRKSFLLARSASFLLLKLQTTQSQLLQVPNDALVQIYDQILINSHPGDKLAQWYSSADGRHWNNKGNSLEAMSLLLAEQGYHELLVAFLWVIVQLHFQGKAYHWLDPHVI